MSKSVPTVTAVVAAYNYARFLPAALDGLIGQTVPFDKIVVVDDGSTDDTPEVLSRYGDRVNAIRIANGGQLGACVEGLKAAESEYVYFLDADDCVPEHFLDAAKPHLADRPDKLQFQLKAIDTKGEPTGSVFPTYPPRYGSAEAKADNELLGFYICPPTSGNIYRRSILMAIDFSLLSMRDFIDGTPNLIAPYLGSVKSLNMPLAFYRVHESSDSQWGNPNRRVLERENQMFERRWNEARAVLGNGRNPAGAAAPAYVLERAMMLAALEGRASSLRTVSGFVRRISRSNLPPKQKVFLAGWAGSFLLPGSAMRQYAVRFRRSPSSRPRLLQQAFRRLLRA